MEGTPSLWPCLGARMRQDGLLSGCIPSVCEDQNVVIRFCRTTAAPDTALGLYNTLTKQLHQLREGTMPSNYQDAVKQWSEALSS